MKKSILLLVLAIIFIFSLTVAASAHVIQTGAAKTETVTLDGTAMTEPAESKSPKAPDKARIQLEVFDANETPAGDIATDAALDVAEDMAADAEPPKGNTPYLIGAGIALFLFIGVAFYCKANGNK